MRVLGTAVKQRPAIGDGSRPHGKVVIDMKGMISSAIRDASSDIHDHSEDRLLRPLAGYTGFNSEMRELAAIIAKVRWTVSVRRVGRAVRARRVGGACSERGVGGEGGGVVV